MGEFFKKLIQNFRKDYPPVVFFPGAQTNLFHINFMHYLSLYNSPFVLSSLIQSLSGLALLFGTILTASWIIKSFKKEHLILIGLILIGVGIFLWFINTGFEQRSVMMDEGFNFNRSRLTNEMMDCSQDDECHEIMEEWMLNNF